MLIKNEKALPGFNWVLVIVHLHILPRHRATKQRPQDFQIDLFMHLLTIYIKHYASVLMVTQVK
jgi:hypothetical protein